MSSLVSVVLVASAALLAVPVCLFCIEVLAAVMVPQRIPVPAAKGRTRPRVAVLVPAHNESGGLLNTLNDVKAQMQRGDRLLVVADNCTDDTAAIAKAAGAEVTERHDPAKIGKGYALDWGVRHLSADPPEIVVIIDADCRLEADALDLLATACAATDQPIQATNLMIAPDQSPIDYRAMMFAFRVKNWVRPLGLRALNLPCQLTGTGMALPWIVVGSADLASDLQVEDMKLGLDLARMGYPPLFLSAARILSEFPASIEGAKSQRKRWEQGHIDMIGAAVPSLIYQSLRQSNFRLLALALDVAIPPLALLGASLSAMLAISAVGALCGLSASAFAVSAASFSAYLVAVILCWWQFGRDLLPLNSIAAVVCYSVSKLPLYLQMLSGRKPSHWIRTDRGKVQAKFE